MPGPSVLHLPRWISGILKAYLHASVLMPCILGHYAPLRRAMKAQACLKIPESTSRGLPHPNGPGSHACHFTHYAPLRRATKRKRA